MTRDSAGLAGSIMGRLQALPRRLKAAGGVLALVTLALAVMAPWIALAGMAGIAIGVAAARLAEAAGTEALPPDAVALRTQQPLDEGVSPVLAWRGLVDALPDPVIAIDDNQFVVHANPPAYDLFAAMRRGGPVALASRSPELAEALAHALRYRERRTVRLHERVPVERQLDATLSPVRTRSPGFPALLIELHDISERDRLAQMRADFVAHASHELRTPLAALRGFVETLQGAAKDDPVARERFLGIMWAESLRMTRILDDLLSLARVEMRAHLVPSDRVPVNATLAGVVRSMEPLAATVGAKVEVSAPPTELYARGDRDEIVQVLVNLLQNALKYGRKGGNVTITVSRSAAGGRKMVGVAISDDGPGIDEKHLPRLTERFYRIDDKTSREKGGTGLGLAIVKHILNRHEGELRIESHPGVGSTFAVTLPEASD